jgi:hypothetical protein
MLNSSIRYDALLFMNSLSLVGVRCCAACASVLLLLLLLGLECDAVRVLLLSF